MKGFEMALWPNDNKEPGGTQPDATGFITIPISVLKELSIAYQQKQLPVENDTRNNLEVVKLGASAWKNDPNNGKRQPVIKAVIRNFEEQKESAARKAQYEAERNGASTAPATETASGWDIPF